MLKFFLVGGYVKEEVEGNFYFIEEFIINGKIFKFVDSVVYIFSKYYCFFKNVI